MSGLTIVAVGLFGGVGAVARLLLDGEISARLRGSFPAGTIVVNLVGSFLLGLLVGAGTGEEGLRLLAVGLLGSFTTFSTWMFETQRLAEDGEGGLALVNVAVSLAAGIGLAWAGMQIGELL